MNCSITFLSEFLFDTKPLILIPFCNTKAVRYFPPPRTQQRGGGGTENIQQKRKISVVFVLKA